MPSGPLFPNMRAFIPAIVCLAISVLGLIFLQAQPDLGTNQVAVIFPFSETLEEKFHHTAAAGTPIVRTGANGKIVIVQIKNQENIKSLYHNGAILVFNPLFNGNCFIKKTGAVNG